MGKVAQLQKLVATKGLGFRAVKFSVVLLCVSTFLIVESNNIRIGLLKLLLDHHAFSPLFFILVAIICKLIKQLLRSSMSY